MCAVTDGRINRVCTRSKGAVWTNQGSGTNYDRTGIDECCVCVDKHILSQPNIYAVVCVKWWYHNRLTLKLCIVLVDTRLRSWK